MPLNPQSNMRQREALPVNTVSHVGRDRCMPRAQQQYQQQRRVFAAAAAAAAEVATASASEVVATAVPAVAAAVAGHFVDVRSL